MGKGWRWSLALLLWSSAAAAQWLELRYVDPRLSWRTLESAHFSVHFAERNRAEAARAASVAERVYPRITSRLAWEPRARTHLVLLDSADFANGSAAPVPFNRETIFLSPPDQGELLQNRDWLELVLTHEFFHIVHLDKASGSPLNLRGVLGRLLPFFPNVLQPPWIVEGLAVEAESDAARGYGRLGHSFFEGMMRAEVGRGLRPLAEVNAEGRGFPLNRDYLYGSYFFKFVRERYGDDAVRRLIDEYSSNVVPFKVQSNTARATGKPMDALWVEYQDWLRARFAPRGEPRVEGEVLSRAFYISAPVVSEGGERWYVQGDAYTRPRLMRQAAGEPPRPMRRVEEDTRLAPASAGGVLVSELDICRNYNLVYKLYRVDARGRHESLDACGRLRFAAPLDGGRVAAIRVADSAAEVVLVLLLHGTVSRTLYRTAPGESLSGLAAHGERVVVTSLRGGRWALLELGGEAPRVLLADTAVKHSPRFDAAGELYFVADYGGSYDVWSLRGATLARWSRTAYGVKEISAPLAGELLLTTIEAQGDALRLLKLADAPLETRAVAVEAAAPEATEEVDATERPYSALPSLRPTAWVPIVQIGEGLAAFGVAVYGQDALGVHQYVAAPIVEVKHRELLGELDYVYDGRHGVHATRTLTASEGAQTITLREDAQWVSLWRHLALNRRFYWGGGAATEQETRRERAGGTLRVQDERVVALVAGVDSRRAHWLSEGPSEGQELRLFGETASRLGGAYTGNVYRADWRGHLALGRTVLALRWNEAYAQRGAEPLELGGSRSDDYIPLPVLNQRNFPLRGYGNGESVLTGHRARLATLEWRTPLADVDRHLMVPPLGLNRLALNLFLDVGAAWERGERPDYHRGVGVELVSEPRFGYLFGGLQVRAGLAKGLDAPGRTLAYLRVGRSF